VTAGKIAAGAVGPLALAGEAVRDVHMGVDQRLPESYLALHPSGGHDHDGVHSRSLPAAVVDTRQLRERTVVEAHFESVPADNDLSPAEETYARGRGFTPGNVLRAVRDLAEHTGFLTRALLTPGAYSGIAGTPMIIRGFNLNNLPDAEDGERANDFVAIELRVPERDAVARALAEILDDHSLRVTVPDLGAQEAAGHLLAVRGDGSSARPYTPVSNAVRFTYQPPAQAVSSATLRRNLR